MLHFDEQLTLWARHRSRLEREARALLVHPDEALRAYWSDTLYRCRVSTRSVPSLAAAASYLGHERYTLLLTAEIPNDSSAVAFQELLFICDEPSQDVINQCFEHDNITLLLQNDAPALQSELIQQAVARSVNQTMRTYLLEQLRQQLAELEQSSQTNFAEILQQRLWTVKSTLLTYEKVLVVEQSDDNWRTLSEQLLLRNIGVEVADSLNGALTRLAEHSFSLLCVPAIVDAAEIPKLLQKIQVVDGWVAVMVSATEFDMGQALSALRSGASNYLLWPSRDTDAVLHVVQKKMTSIHRERLMHHLFVELLRHASLSPEQSETFRGIAGLRHPIHLNNEQRPIEMTGPLPRLDTSDYIDEVLAAISEDSSARIVIRSENDNDKSGADRRTAPRLPRGQYARFRAPSAPTSQLGRIGDVSERGIFIRTDILLQLGTRLELDCTLEHEGQLYVVQCDGVVARIVPTDDQSTGRASGLGIKFVNLSAQATALLTKILA